MKRRTKIIATLGPACDDPQVLEALLQAVDLVRLNFSHAQASEHAERIAAVRKIAQKKHRVIGVIADLQGPKIRIKKFKQGAVQLQKGQSFILDASLDDMGDETRVGIDYKALVNDISVGDVLLLDDGKIQLNVTGVQGKEIITEVQTAARLSDHKGINRMGGGLSAECLTEKDVKDIHTAIELGVDYIAISFPRDAADIKRVREIVVQLDPEVNLIAKIERAEALDCIDEIIQAADAVMVARGDLGVEIGIAAVPSAQKKIIQLARNLDKAVITATQMMESMIVEPVPTRAEVSDVANAVLDGTDAVMLSAETATGKHPVKVAEAMAKVCVSAEENPLTLLSKHRMERTFTSIDEAIAMAAMYTANHLRIKAIIALTESGATALWMSRIRSGIPIYGLSRNLRTQRRMTLYRGVYPVSFDPTLVDRKAVNKAAVTVLQQSGEIGDDDIVILSKGDSMGTLGGTNAMKVLRVAEVV
jgi:pyruvate kinase